MQLATRQRELALLVGQGLNDKVIAEKMGLDVGTVRVYIVHLRKKLGVWSCPEKNTRAAVVLECQKIMEAMAS